MRIVIAAALPAFAFGCAGEPQSIDRGLDDAVKRDRAQRDAGCARAAELCARAEGSFRQGRIDDAWRDWCVALTADPNCAPARNGRGLVKAARGEIDSDAIGTRGNGALAEFDEAIRLDPASAEYLTNRGYNRARIHDIAGATADFNRAVALDPDHVGALHNRGLLKALLGDDAGAAEDYTQALRRRPDYFEVYNNRGVARGRLGDFKGALEDFEAACKLRPDYVGAQINRLGTLVSLGDRVRASREADALLKDPKTTEAVRRYAREFLELLRRGQR